MLKLERDIKFRALPEHFKEHLSFFPHFLIKQLIAGFTFVMLDLLVLIPIIYPMIDTTFYLTIPFILLINIWAIRLLILNPEKTELESILFLGALGAVGSYSVFILIQKMNYYVLQVNSLFYLMASILLYIVVICFFSYIKVKKFSTIIVLKKKNEQHSTFTNSIITISVSAGYMVAQIVINQSLSIMNTYMIVIFSLLLLFFTDMAVKYIHRYLFMKSNLNVVKLSKKI
jgi:hypothetical protein